MAIFIIKIAQLNINILITERFNKILFFLNSEIFSKDLFEILDYDEYDYLKNNDYFLFLK